MNKTTTYDFSLDDVTEIEAWSQLIGHVDGDGNISYTRVTLRQVRAISAQLRGEGRHIETVDGVRYYRRNEKAPTPTWKRPTTDADKREHNRQMMAAHWATRHQPVAVDERDESDESTHAGHCPFGDEYDDDGWHQTPVFDHDAEYDEWAAMVDYQMTLDDFLASGQRG